MKVGAFYSLALRPAAINACWLTALAFSMPFLALSETGPFPWNYWGADFVPNIILRLLWRETLIMPAALGTIAGGMASSLRGTLISWTLPGVRRVVTAGTLYILAGLVIIIAFTHSRLGGDPVAAVGVAAITFTAFALLANGMQWRTRRLVIAAVLLLCIKPGVLVTAVAFSPLPFALLTVVSAGWLVRSLRSAHPHREQAMRQLMLDPPAGWRRFVLTRMDRMENVSIKSDGSWVSWLHVANSAAGVSGWGWMKSPAISGALWGVFGYMLDSPMFYTMYAMVLWTSTSRGLAGSFLYPVVRRRRATVAYVSALAYTAVYSVTGAGVTTLLRALKPFAGLLGVSSKLPAPILPATAILVVWMPIALWGHLRVPVLDAMERTRRGVHAFTTAFFVSIACYFLFIIVSFVMYQKYAAAFTIAQLLLAFAVLAASTHTTLIFALRRMYATRDLI